jgi:thymidylate synthase
MIPVPIQIVGTSIPDTWFQLVYKLLTTKEGVHSYRIDKGSYVGQRRLEFDYCIAVIKYPAVEPLIPEFPVHINAPPPVESMEYVERYFYEYLMDPSLKINETYKYATWIAPGVERVIRQLKDSPGNNQACINLGGIAHAEFVDERFPNGFHHYIDTDTVIDPATDEVDPACLRVIDFRLDNDNCLHMYLYWRSHDLWGGFPANLAGLQKLKEYVAQEIGAHDGCIISTSKGLHLYDHSIDIACQRCNIDKAKVL